MTVEPASPERLSEAVRLSTLLAERVLDTLITKRAVPAEQALALAKAARFLQGHDVEWPPLLTQVVYEMANRKDEAPSAEAEPSKALAETVAGRFARFFSKSRSEADQA
ncbi:hypothetical protein [Methylobacterium sp. J-076]|uniref:hypothetical protein n=1 Tax=Methylobacterium sp. J-076 TaxID=2836655 RepID=UPI001FBB16FE|nr:hypothetical protein [Methylobacterium sp. J-076]MCJ2012151.1 hypothetical protein [Methylobacterium sp. J-076]